MRIHCISAGTALRAETFAGQAPEFGYLAQRDSTLANAMSQCELFGYTPPQAAVEVAHVITSILRTMRPQRARRAAEVHLPSPTLREDKTWLITL